MKKISIFGGVLLFFLNVLVCLAEPSVSQKAIYETKKIIIDLPPNQLTERVSYFQRGKPKEVGLFFSRIDSVGDIGFQSRLEASSFKPVYWINGGMMNYTHTPWLQKNRYELRALGAFGFYQLQRTALLNYSYNAQKEVTQNLFILPVKLGLENRFLISNSWNLSSFLQISMMPLGFLTNETSIADAQSFTALGAEAALGLLWMYKGLGVDFRVHQILGALEQKNFSSRGIGFGLRTEL